jgi:hypothetical protein
MNYETTKAPLSERLEFFKFQYSCQTFAHARKTLLYIQEQGVLSGHPLHHTLWTAFIVLYGKPFKQRPLLRLDADLVQNDWRETHQTLLDFRDKMFAHTDLDLVAEQSLDPLNSIVVTIQDGAVTMGTGFIYPDPESTAKYRLVVDSLIQKTNELATKRWESWNVIADYNGRYVINVGTKSDDVLLPIDWEAGSYVGRKPT